MPPEPHLHRQHRFILRPGRQALLSLAAIVCAAELVLLLVLGVDAGRSLIAAALSALAVAWVVAQHLATTIELDGDRLRIRNLMTSFEDRIDNIEPDCSAKFDYRADRRFALRRRLLGTTLYNFRVGWFLLRDGSPAFACLSRQHRARALTTRDGCRVLLDPGVARRLQRSMERQRVAPG